MRRHAELVIVNRHCVHVRGFGTRAALVELTGKAPLWSAVNRAWVVSERTARNLLLPHLENLGYDVSVQGGEQ
jgi:hypothetical protein